MRSVVIKTQYSSLAELPLARPYFSHPIFTGKSVEISEDNAIKPVEIFFGNGMKKHTNNSRRIERRRITSVGFYNLDFPAL